MITKMSLKEICSNVETFKEGFTRIERKNRGLLDYETTINNILAGLLVAWKIENENKSIGYFFTFVDSVNGEKIFHIQSLFGEGVSEILKNMPQLMDEAIKLGCTQMIILGRKGWKNFLQPYGFRDTLYLYSTELK